MAKAYVCNESLQPTFDDSPMYTGSDLRICVASETVEYEVHSLDILVFQNARTTQVVVVDHEPLDGAKLECSATICSVTVRLKNDFFYFESQSLNTIHGTGLVKLQSSQDASTYSDGLDFTFIVKGVDETPTPTFLPSTSPSMTTETETETPSPTTMLIDPSVYPTISPTAAIAMPSLKPTSNDAGLNPINDETNSPTGMDSDDNSLDTISIIESPNLNSSSTSNSLIIGGAIGFVALSLVAVLVFRRRRSPRNQIKDQESPLGDLDANNREEAGDYGLSGDLNHWRKLSPRKLNFDDQQTNDGVDDSSTLDGEHIATSSRQIDGNSTLFGESISVNDYGKDSNYEDREDLGWKMNRLMMEQLQGPIATPLAVYLKSAAGDSASEISDNDVDSWAQDEGTIGSLNCQLDPIEVEV